jgi:hypothetical protein
MRTVQDIVAVDIVRLRSKLYRAETENKNGDTDNLHESLIQIAGLAMNLATKVAANNPE